MKRRRELRRTGPPKRRKPMKKANRKRKAKLHARNFGEHADTIRARPCDGCGMPPPSDPAHTRARGMGGCKGSAEDLVSLCFDRPYLLRPGCHLLHDRHPEKFTERTGKTREDMVDLAAILWGQHLERKAAA